MAKVKEINLTDDEALLLKNDGSAIRQFEGISYFVVIRTKSDIRIIWEICLKMLRKGCRSFIKSSLTPLCQRGVHYSPFRKEDSKKGYL